MIRRLFGGSDDAEKCAHEETKEEEKQRGLAAQLNGASKGEKEGGGKKRQHSAETRSTNVLFSAVFPHLCSALLHLSLALGLS